MSYHITAYISRRRTNNGRVRYDRGSTFRLKCFLSDGPPSPQIVVNSRSLFYLIVVVYLDHGMFHLVAVLFFSKSVLEEVLSSQIEETQKKRGAPLIYRASMNTYMEFQRCWAFPPLTILVSQSTCLSTMIHPYRSTTGTE